MMIKTKNPKKVGFFITLCSALGGFFIGALSASIFALFAPISLDEGVFLSFLLIPLLWAIAGLWIYFSYTKKQALARSIIGVMVLSIVLFIKVYYAK